MLWSWEFFEFFVNLCPYESTIVWSSIVASIVLGAKRSSNQSKVPGLRSDPIRCYQHIHVGRFSTMACNGCYVEVSKSSQSTICLDGSNLDLIKSVYKRITLNPIDSVDFILNNFILLKKRLKVERMNSDETESETPGPTPLPDHRVLQPAWRRRQPRVTKPVEPGTLRGFEERLFCNFAFPCIAAASNIASLRLLTKLTLSFFGACLSHQAQNDSTWSRHGAPCLAEMSGWSWVKDFANCHCVWLCLTVSVCPKGVCINDAHIRSDLPSPIPPPGPTCPRLWGRRATFLAKELRTATLPTLPTLQPSGLMVESKRCL